MTTRESLNLGASANDPNADGLRAGAFKIQRNFEKIWLKLGGDSDIMTSGISLEDQSIVFEGTSTDAFETRLSAQNPTADRSIILPNSAGTIVLDTSSQTLTNKALTSPVVSNLSLRDLSGSFNYVVKGSNLATNRDVTLPTLAAADTFVFANATQTLSNKTFNSGVFNGLSINGSIYDANGARHTDVVSIAAAVNYLRASNSATGVAPSYAVEGQDADISLSLLSKNGGAVRTSKIAHAMTTVTADGVVPRTSSFIDCNKGTALVLTLPNGVVHGEVKIFTNRGAGEVTVTPASFAQGTSFSISQNEAVQTIWNGLNWFIFGNQSTVTIA